VRRRRFSAGCSAAAGERLDDQAAQFGHGGDDQVALDPAAQPLQPRAELGELLVGGAADLGQRLAGLGRGVAARVALEELDAQPRLERVDVADDGGVVHAQRLGRAADGAGARDVPGGADLVPGVDGHRRPSCGCGQLGRSAAQVQGRRA
jgi:hypothetical protein